jgi:recombinational DNA repair protein (RecF pathway)
MVHIFQKKDHSSHTLQQNSVTTNSRTIQYVLESHVDETSAEKHGENEAHQWPTHGNW